MAGAKLGLEISSMVHLQLTKEGIDNKCTMKAQMLLIYGSSPAQPLNIVLCMCGN